MAGNKTTFALFFGNRGFFPASLIAQARQDLPRLLAEWGYDSIMMDEAATRYGAVETTREGQQYAAFLAEHRGRYDGVILCLPNFGDETGAVAALKDAGVPILVQAYPDELDKMSPAQRRDAFCGKLSIMDVFYQYDVKFTALKPHVVAPDSKAFRDNVDYFARLCRVVNGVNGMTVGAIGARTTPFKTVRFDEVALQRHGITTETVDMSDVLARVATVDSAAAAYTARADKLRGLTSWQGVPEQSFDRLVRLSVVLDGYIDELQLDALAIRCWTELESQLGIAPCVLLGELNDRGIAAACEVDVCNAVMMYALGLATRLPATCLDWNNNYADQEDKCILFHCGPVPPSLMAKPGKIVDNPILATALGPGCSIGCNVGRIAPGDFTFGSLITDAGAVRCYLGTGRITADPIAEDFFGCAGVAEISELEEVLLHIGRNGFRHHVSLTPGTVVAPLYEALAGYLDFDVSLPQWED